MIRLLTSTAVAALLVASAPAWAQTSPRPVAPTTGAAAGTAQTVEQHDRDFMNEAAIGGKFEVDLGKTAESKAKNQAVKDFAKHMVDDHGKANDKLAASAKDLKVTLPTQLDTKHKDAADRLGKLSGDQFDHDYMAEMVKDHQEDAAAFQKATTTVSNPQVKAFATETLPVIQQHLKMAQDIQAKLGPATPLTSSAPGGARSGSSGTAPTTGPAGGGIR